MERDIFIGIVLLISALGFIVYLVLWSCRTIDFISRKKIRGIHEIMKALNDRQ